MDSTTQQTQLAHSGVTAGQTDGASYAPYTHDPAAAQPVQATKQNPLAVGPSPEGGVAIAGQSGLPISHPTTKDKIIGGIDKVLAAATFDKAGVETAKLRQAGGKAATVGEARAPVNEL